MRTKLEKTFREEIGENLFNQALQEYCEEHGYGKGEYAVENSTTINVLVRRLHKVGAKSKQPNVL